MYALCDASSMYASCEKIFDPAIRDKPVVVLSNNDGCIVAACPIAKRLGVGKDFSAYFKVREQLAALGVVIRSSNYELYADISQRMMDTCARFAPRSHIYSIDECFLDFSDWQQGCNWLEHGWQIRRTVWREVRLPVGVGIAATPTLAKAANHAAKKLPGFRGVAVIDSEAMRRQILEAMTVDQVWGVGRRLAKRLQALGIETAWQLAAKAPGWIAQQFSVSLADTVYELTGVQRISWDDVRSPKQSIFSTRSFGQRVNSPELLHQALVSHVSIAAAKLRRQQGLARCAVFFAHNSPHDSAAYYRSSISLPLAVPTQDDRVLARAARQVLGQIYRPGVAFYKCGVGLLDICDACQYQQDLFQPSNDSPALLACLDQINLKYGRDTLRLARHGDQQRFAMRREFLSPCYTTRLADIPKARC